MIHKKIILCIFCLINILNATTMMTDIKDERKILNSTNRELNIPKPIQNFLNATNNGNNEELINIFTKDAYLRDWFRIFNGHKGVSSWNISDNIGKDTHFDIQSIRNGEKENSYIVSLKVSGKGFNGNSNIFFLINDNLISELIISPF